MRALAIFQKKRYIITLILLVFPILATADYFDQKQLFGISLIHQSAGSNLSNGSSASNNGTGIGMYFDRYDQQTYRYNNSFNYIQYSGAENFNIIELTMGADFLIPVMMDSSLFAGMTVGAVMQKFSNENITNAAIEPLYGVQFGGIKYLNENFLLELGYRIRATNLTTNDDVTNISSNLHELNEFYFNLLFMY